MKEQGDKNVHWAEGNLHWLKHIEPFIRNILWEDAQSIHAFMLYT